MPQGVQLLPKKAYRHIPYFSGTFGVSCPPAVCLASGRSRTGCSGQTGMLVPSTTASLAAPHQNLGPLSHFSDSLNPGCITALVCTVWIQNKSLGISKWLLKATWSARSVLPRLSRGSEGDVFNVAWQNTAGWLSWGQRGWSQEKLFPCYQKQPRLYSSTSSNSTGFDCELEERRKSGSQNWFHSRWYFLHNNLFLSGGHRLGKYLVKGQ